MMYLYAAADAKPLQSCPTLRNPTDGSSPGFPVPGILQARTLEWVAISFSRCMQVKSESEVAQSCPTLATPWTAATRLLHPWDFPGRSTGVGCHCLLQKEEVYYLTQNLYAILHKTHFKYNYISRLKVNRWEKTHHANILRKLE